MNQAATAIGMQRLAAIARAAARVGRIPSGPEIARALRVSRVTGWKYRRRLLKKMRTQ